MAICLDFVEELLVTRGRDRTREDSMKLNLINHSDRQTRTEPTLPRTIIGNIEKWGGEASSLTGLYLFLWKLKIPESKQCSDLSSVCTLRI